MKHIALLVEDNDANRYLATFLLEQNGIEVIHARNGRECIDKLVTIRPDLIVLDIHMPEMDGYEVVAHLKASPRDAHIPVLVSSSYAMAGDRQKALRLGAFDYIEKPYDPEDFLKRVARILSGEAQP